jgi:aspartyl/asparaginyl beta-hydroxylase (cupin superfamily)
MAWTLTPEQRRDIESFLDRVRADAPPKALDRLDSALAMFVAGKQTWPGAHPLQRPVLYVPGLTAQPWHVPQTLDAVALLEASWREIADELESMLQRRAGFQPYEHHAEAALAPGNEWMAMYFAVGGQPIEPNRRLCPRTAAVLDRIPNLSETAIFSELKPGVHLKPHCGLWNCRLTIHLGLIVPSQTGIRVGGEAREWRAGECLVFDDSFLHEAWNLSDRIRVVLLLDVWHPDLTPVEVQVLSTIQRWFANRSRMIDHVINGQIA